MSDQTTNALLGIRKTLTDTVAPALNPSDPLAQQELRMVIRYLQYLAERVDHIHSRARFELDVYASLATAVAGLLDTSDAARARELERRSHDARLLLDTAGAATGELRAAAAGLSEAISAAVREVQEPSVRNALEREIVSGCSRLTTFERTWYLPLGMDHFGSELPPLGSFLASAEPGP